MILKMQIEDMKVKGKLRKQMVMSASIFSDIPGLERVDTVSVLPKGDELRKHLETLIANIVKEKKNSIRMEIEKKRKALKKKK